MYASIVRPFMGRTYLDVQMGDISLVEVGKSFHQLSDKVDHVTFEGHQITVYQRLQVSARCAEKKQQMQHLLLHRQVIVVVKLNGQLPWLGVALSKLPLGLLWFPLNANVSEFFLHRQARSMQQSLYIKQVSTLPTTFLVCVSPHRPNKQGMPDFKSNLFIFAALFSSESIDSFLLFFRKSYMSKVNCSSFYFFYIRSFDCIKILKGNILLMPCGMKRKF